MTDDRSAPKSSDLVDLKDQERALEILVADTPLVLVGPMWEELVAWHRKAMLRPGAALASEGDLSIPRCVPGAKEAIAIVRAHHAAWARGVRA